MNYSGFGEHIAYRIPGNFWTSQHGITPLILKSVPNLQYIEITLIRNTARKPPPRVLQHLILSAATGFSKPVPTNLGVTLIRAAAGKP